MTYLMLLWWVAIGGVVIAALAQGWRVQARRQKDMELAFRARQIAVAIQSYYDATPTGPKVLPTSLDQLLEDRRGPALKRHLRQPWPDPITGGPWGLIKSGPGIRGIYSLSDLKPVRGDPSFRTYKDWRFFMTSAGPPGAAASAASALETVPIPVPDAGR